jgi:hypothetical protein
MPLSSSRSPPALACLLLASLAFLAPASALSRVLPYEHKELSAAPGYREHTDTTFPGSESADVCDVCKRGVKEARLDSWATFEAKTKTDCAGHARCEKAMGDAWYAVHNQRTNKLLTPDESQHFAVEICDTLTYCSDKPYSFKAKNAGRR